MNIIWHESLSRCLATTPLRKIEAQMEAASQDRDRNIIGEE
jgi:hypothetical protein